MNEVSSDLEFSLHTEYSYGKRKFDSEIIKKFPELINAQKDGVPQLWKNEEWASQFADYIVAMVDGKAKPKVIEIHPPFDDYSDMESFIKSYIAFERKIRKFYPSVDILIENRCGSVYRGGKFILSKTKDLIELSKLIERDNINLKIAYDVPQIYAAHNVKKKEQYISLLKDAKSIRKHIGGVHLWGKKTSPSGRRVAHCGDLNTYFSDNELKKEFLKELKELFNDDITRKMVLEVNTGNDDLTSIVNDLLDNGFDFK